MKPSLLAYTNRHLEQDVRTILRANGATDLSTEACRKWAQWYIAQVVRDWEPGRRLMQTEYERVGYCFHRALEEAKAKLGIEDDE